MPDLREVTCASLVAFGHEAVVDLTEVTFLVATFLGATFVVLANSYCWGFGGFWSSATARGDELTSPAATSASAVVSEAALDRALMKGCRSLVESFM
ncbi:MAG: hypothetical protein IPL41_03400 [Micropruina sp.]|nr:hypothetical protein [Micropruina sp.]